MAENKETPVEPQREEVPAPDETELGSQNVIDQVLAGELNVPPEEVTQYVTDRWQSAQKAELVRDNANLFFKCREYRQKLRQWQQRAVKLAQQAGKKPEEIQELMGSAAAAGGGGGNLDVVQLIKALKDVLQPQQQGGQDDTRQMMKDLLPVLLLSNKMGGGGNDQQGMNVAELIKELKDVLKPEQQQRETVQMDLGGQVVNVPVELALMMGQQQQGVTREDIEQIIQSTRPQQQVDPQQLKQQVKEEFRQDKEFWQEYFQGGRGSDPEVEKERIKQETKREQIKTDAELKKEEQKMKRQEVEAQQQLVNAIMNPTGVIDQSTGERKRTVESAGANAAAGLID